MAISASRQTTGGLPYRIIGTRKQTVTDITFDSSYPTGGEAVTAADLGLNVVHKDVDCKIKSVGGTVDVTSVYYDDVNAKLIAYDQTPAEVTDTNDLSTLVVRVTARGH